VEEPASNEVLVREFDQHLTERATRPHWALQNCLAESRLHAGPWETPLGSMLAGLDAGAVVREARRLGRAWLAAEEKST
jgi:hypothetical protein